MRDSGFEFVYQGKKYFAKEGDVDSFKSALPIVDLTNGVRDSYF